MPSIHPVPRSGAAPTLPSGTAALATPVPVAGATPVPAGAGRSHVATLGDSITLGVGLIGVGALGVAAFGSEAVALGAATLGRNAVTAAKAFGPKIAEDWKAGAERLRTPSGVGTVAAEQTTAAVADWTRSAIIGTGLSAGASLAQRAAHALSSHQNAQPAPQCSPRPTPDAP